MFESMMGWETETFKIDSTGWKMDTKKTSTGKDINVKVSPAGDVFEYIDGPAKGEQIFIGYKNFLKYIAEAKGCTPEEAEKKYLMTGNSFEEKMKQIEKSKGGYKGFHNKEIAGHMSGFWNSDSEKFYYIGVRSIVWLAGGYSVYFHGDKWDRYCLNSDYGFSDRLLQN